MTDKLYKLPLFAKSQQLKSFPGADAKRVFMIADAIKPQPERSMGYLVEQVSGRSSPSPRGAWAIWWSR